MQKCNEVSDPNSCLNKARDDEWLFVLLGRDLAAADTVLFWVTERLKRGLNLPRDPQIMEALEWSHRVKMGYGIGMEE